jgi:quinol monooxygenase YgiN
MFLIVVKFQVKPEWTERWMDLVGPFTEATRAEPGNLFFDWSRSLEDPQEFVLVEGFTDDGAGPHVSSDHFRDAIASMPQALLATPRIISKQVDGDGFGPMGEMTIEQD